MRILIITGGRIDEDFTLSLLEKEKFEQLKAKSNIRKENLKLKIKENLETNNYKIQSNDAENETDKLENKNQGEKNEE